MSDQNIKALEGDYRMAYRRKQAVTEKLKDSHLSRDERMHLIKEHKRLQDVIDCLHDHLYKAYNQAHTPLKKRVWQRLLH